MIIFYSMVNDMVNNTEKTKAMKFGKAGALGKQKLFIDRTSIEFVLRFKYLGVLLQPALGFHDHIAPKPARTTTLKLDGCKTPHLKSTLDLSTHTSNTFVLALTAGQTLCEDPKDMGYEFKVWEEYAEART